MRVTGLWWWIDRWRKSTAYTDMTLEQQGAYRNLLDEAHLRGGAIPDDDRVLAKACGDAIGWRKLRPVVLARFYKADEGWRNETLDSIIRESTRRADKQRRYRKNEGSAGGNDSGNESGNQGGNAESNETGNAGGNAAGNEGGNTDRPPVPGTGVLVRTGLNRSVQDLREKDLRARGAGNRRGVGAGTFPADHVTHLACGPVCFHPRMAAKFIGRFGNDRSRLEAWAKGVCAAEQGRVAGGTPVAEGDDFAYWTAEYNRAFGRKTPEPESEGRYIPNVEETNRMLDERDGIRRG